VIAAGGAFSSVAVGLGAGGKVMVNSPWSLNNYLSLLGYFGITVTGSVVGNAVIRTFTTAFMPSFSPRRFAGVNIFWGDFSAA
jgi:hypothetical protein